MHGATMKNINDNFLLLSEFSILTLGLTSLLYNGKRVISSGIATGAYSSPPTTSSAEFKERVELYLTPPLCLRDRL